MSKAYYHTKESVLEYIKLSEGHDGGHLIEPLKNFLSAQSSVLEIGSGEGKDIELLSKTYQVTGSDYSEEFLKLLRGRLPNNKLLQLNAATLETDLRFDGIYSNKVLHHLTDEELLHSIKRQHEMLNRGGMICHSFWLGEGEEEFKGMYVNYHTQEELEELLASKFSILHLEVYAEMWKGDSLLLIAEKK